MGSEFREMRRSKQQLSHEECEELLRNEVHGTLAMFGDGGYPYAIPLHFTYDGEKGIVYLHGARSGHKIDALRKNDKVCFTVYDGPVHEDEAGRSYHHCVVIFGRVRLVEDEDEKMRSAWDLCAKFETPQEVEDHLRREVATVQMLILSIDHMTGKRVKAQSELPLFKRNLS